MHTLCIGVNHRTASVSLRENLSLGEEALRAALRLGSTGAVLSRLFQTAVHAGKRVRNESAISSGPSTVSSIRRMPALDEAERQRIDALTRALVKTLLHFPTLYPKEQSRYGEEVPGAQLTRKLFGLDDRDADDKNHQYMDGPDGTN